MSPTSQVPQITQSELLFPPFHIPAGIDLLYRAETIVALERRAVQVLRYLVEHHDRVVSKDELLEAVWPGTFISDGVLKRAISQARRALGDVAEESKFIETYHGRGYRFVARVQTKAEPPEAKPAVTGGAARGETFLEEARALPFVSHPSPQPSAATVSAAPPFPPNAISSAPHYNQLVGRETEMAQLQGDYRQALEGAGRPVLMIGEPGIGKTQLAREFANWARAQGAVCLYAQFFDYQASRLAPYEVFLDLLRNLLGVNASNREDCDLRVLAQNHFGVSLPEELFTDARVNSQLRLSSTTGALRLEEVSARKTGPLTAPRATGALSGGVSRAVASISQCLIRASHHRPLVLVLDDVQWAGEASRELIGHLMRTLRGEPLMLVCLSRAESLSTAGAGSETSFAQWLKRLAGYRSFTTLGLKPLDEAASADAIDAVFGGQVVVPAADLARLQGITGGNPYFLVEMLRLLVAERAICFDPNGAPVWQWRGIKDLSLPATIVMAAEAKLDRLSESVREIVECASVIGDEFRIETLTAMTGRGDEEIERLVLEGVRCGVLAERGVSADNDARFHHTTLRRVLYDALPARRRKRMHLRAAQSIEAMYLFEPDRVADALSAHYEAAGHWERAFEWSIRAWQAASSRLSWGEAMVCLDRAERAARELAAGSGNQLAPAEQLKLLLALGETHFATGRLKESDTAYGDAVMLARALSDRNALATILLQQGQTRMSMELYSESAAVTEQALEHYRDLGDQEGAGLALVQLGGIQVRQGNYDAAVALAQQALEDVALNSQVAAIAFGLLGWARALQGHLTEGVPLLERAVEYLSSVGDLQRRSLLLRRGHWAELGRGRYEAAVELALRARDDAHRLGDATCEAQMDMGIGQARLAQGLYAEAIELLSRAQERLRLVGNTHFEAEALCLLGRACCESGQLAQARKLLERSLEMMLEVGDRDDEYRVMTALVRLAVAEGDAQAALQFADNAFSIAEELHNHDDTGILLIDAAHAHFLLGQSEDALANIVRAIDLLERAESGDRWRAYWIKAQILQAQCATLPGEEKPFSETSEALQRAVALLDEIRQQLGKDEARMAEITRSRRAPARDLHALLLSAGQMDKARELAQRWGI